MTLPHQSIQLGKIMRAVVASAAIVGPYIYSIAQPEKSIEYRFVKATDENGKNIRVNATYNKIAAEMAYRMKLHKQVTRNSNVDIRTILHTGLEFDANGSFSPVFDGIVYLVIPQWANLSSMDDLKKLKINHAGEELDFSKINYSLLDLNKIRIGDVPIEEKKPSEVSKPDDPEPKSQSKSFFNRWFSRQSNVEVQQPSAEPVAKVTEKTEFTPISREALLIERLIGTFNLSDNAKRYIIADQLDTGTGPWHFIPWFIIAGSSFLPFSLYTRFRLKFGTRLKRFFFFHFLLLNSAAFFYLSPFAARLVNLQISRIRDSSTASYGLDMIEGGIEFLEKQIERNRILRELLPNGKNSFDPDGESRKTQIELSSTLGLTISLHHWNPLIEYRLKHLRKKLNYILSLDEKEARKEIFKDSI